MHRLALIGLVLALGACATAGSGASNTYAAEYDALRAQCDTRNGVLEPTRRNTGQPATDYNCVIRSGPSDRITGR